MIDFHGGLRREVESAFVSVVISFTSHFPICTTENRATNDNVPPAEAGGGHESFYWLRYPITGRQPPNRP